MKYICQKSQNTYIAASAPTVDRLGLHVEITVLLGQCIQNCFGVIIRAKVYLRKGGLKSREAVPLKGYDGPYAKLDKIYYNLTFSCFALETC